MDKEMDVAGAGSPIAHLTPEFVGAPQQRHIGGMFEVCEPNHTRSPVARSLRVTRLELFEAKYALASRCNVRGGGATHAAQANDDDIVPRHVPHPTYPACFQPSCTGFKCSTDLTPGRSTQ